MFSHHKNPEIVIFSPGAKVLLSSQQGTSPLMDLTVPGCVPKSMGSLLPPRMAVRAVISLTLTPPLPCDAMYFTMLVPHTWKRFFFDS